MKTGSKTFHGRTVDVWTYKRAQGKYVNVTESWFFSHGNDPDIVAFTWDDLYETPQGEEAYHLKTDFTGNYTRTVPPDAFMLPKGVHCHLPLPWVTADDCETPCPTGD